MSMWCSYLRMHRWEDLQYFFPCFQGLTTVRKNTGSVKSDMGAFPQMVWKEELNTQVSSVSDDRLPVKTVHEIGIQSNMLALLFANICMTEQQNKSVKNSENSCRVVFYSDESFNAVFYFVMTCLTKWCRSWCGFSFSCTVKTGTGTE